MEKSSGLETVVHGARLGVWETLFTEAGCLQLFSTQIFDSLKYVYIKFNSNCTKILIIVICCALVFYRSAQDVIKLSNVLEICYSNYKA